MNLCRATTAARSIILLGVLTQQAAAVVIDVPLTLAPASPSSNRFNIAVDAEVFLAGAVADDADTDLTGAVSSQLDVTLLPQGAEVAGIRFLGGDISAADIQLTLAGVAVTTTGLGGSIVTPGGGFSSVADGQFPTADHQLTLNAGTLNFPGGSIDYAAEPLDTPGVAGVSATLATQLIGQDGATQTYGVEITLPIAAEEFLPVGFPVLNGGVNLDFAGTVVLLGQFEIDLPAAGDFNGDGVVDGADYALWRNDFEAGLAPAGDLDLWRQNFSGGNPPAPVLTAAAGGGAPTPEPAAGLMAIAAWMAGSLGRPTRNSAAAIRTRTSRRRRAS
ncbi:MAG: hypothetical protein AAF790_04670 [Planctomycetota bacterium]